MNIGDDVWVFIHDLNYVQIYKGKIRDISLNNKNRYTVYYSEMIIDNYRHYSMVDTERLTFDFNLFETFEDMIEAMDRQKVIESIMESESVANEV